MRAIWRGEDDELGLREGKIYEILGEEMGGEWYDVVDETGDNYLYPAEDFELIKEEIVRKDAEVFSKQS